MPVRPCKFVADCPPEDIFGNFSSETDDTLDYISTLFHGFAPPPFLKQWNRTICGVTFISNTSQLDANLRAAAAALSCPPCEGPECQPTTTQTFCNAPQTCCVPCGDGTSSCYTVPGGLFCNFNNQQSADSAAYNVACQLSKEGAVCMSNLAGCMCVGDNYSGTLTATSIVIWSFAGGSLPPGLSFSVGIGATSTVTGTPTTPGQYTFAIQAQTSIGTSVTKRFTLTVLSIVTTSLPPFTIGVPYSFQLQVTGGSGQYQWKIASGSLPNGLTMSITGLISGTPL